MITAQIDYRNLQILIYQDDKPVENPLPVEVQRAVLKKVIHEVAENFRRELRGQLTDQPPGLDDILLH